MLGTVSEKAGGGAAMVIKTRENAKVAPAASSVNYSDSKAAVQARIKHRFEAPPCLLLAFDEVTRGALLPVGLGLCSFPISAAGAALVQVALGNLRHFNRLASRGGCCLFA